MKTALKLIGCWRFWHSMKFFSQKGLGKVLSKVGPVSMFVSPVISITTIIHDTDGYKEGEIGSVQFAYRTLSNVLDAIPHPVTAGASPGMSIFENTILE